MTEAQNFKGDAIELKMRASAEPALDQTSAALDDFYAGAYDSEAFLLTLYDSGRAPFSDRIPRDAFVSFVRKALINFPFIGNFESYLFILREIFGADTEILFDVPAPGKLEISVNATSDLVFDFLGRELVGGAYEYFTVTTSDGDDILFRGLSGIDTEYELNLLFSEIIPAGIFPTISLDFFSTFTFIGEDGDGEYDVTDSLGNQIIFIEIGG